MNREIRTPSVTNRLNKILKNLPVGLSHKEIEDLFQPICLKMRFVNAHHKRLKNFFVVHNQMEHWADGFMAGGGGGDGSRKDPVIVAGMVMRPTPYGERKRIIMFCIRDDVEFFIKDLRDNVQVIAVQKS
jgi:hypothetical protein